MKLNTFFNQIVDSLLEGLAIEDDGGHLVFANRALEKLLGYERGELVGLHWTKLFIGELPEQQKGLAARQPGGSGACHETSLQGKDGSMIPVLASVRPLLERNRYWGALSTFIDLGEQAHLRAELRQSERTALIGQNVSAVAHELNNLVTIILLQIRLLHRTDPSILQFQERMDALEEQGQRARRIMDNLFASAAPRQPRLEATDVNSLIQRTLEHQVAIFEMNGFRLHTRLAADLPTVQADPYQLQQVFVNLINNAYQAAQVDKGVGNLEISTELTLNDHERLSRIQIQFADSGPGIPPDIMPHIFKPFFTTKRPGQGMGLGLSVCDEIIRAHQGRIRAENNADGGTSFILELPMTQSMQRVEPVQTNQPQNPIEALILHSALFCLDRETVFGR